MISDESRGSPPRPDFVLSKWYLDCVAEDGAAVIGYHARLAYRALRLNYSGTLVRSTEGEVRSRVSLRRCAPPAVAGPAVRWSNDPLDVRGAWDAMVPAIDATLLADARGVVRWHCRQPLARATVAAGAETISGLGYAERLDLTIPPWRLPIAELRWGRFLAAGAALVWIDWRGAQPATWVFLDGAPVPGCDVDDTGVAGPGLGLRLREGAVLREGPLASTALAGVDALARLIPAHGFQAHERKWISRGELDRERGVSARGWAIHEVVRLSGDQVR